MRILIISDMEGISGIVRWEQVIPGKPLFEEGRRLYTEDVNAAIRGAFDGGADEVVVMDWHGAGDGYSFNSLIPAELDSRCTYVVQERVGSILISALLAHSAWHWMVERGTQLSQYQFQMPIFDALFFAGLMRWGMMLVIVIAVLWGMYELFRRYNLIEGFASYGFGRRQQVQNRQV